MTNDEGHRDAGAIDSVALTPIAILNTARKAVPAIDYAIGAAGIAAAGSIVVALLGHGRAAIIIIGGLFIAMVLLFAFARLVTAQNAAGQSAGVSLLWMVIVFFGTFLIFTVTAVAFQWPSAWAQILGIARDDSFDEQAIDKQAMQKLLEVPKEISNKLVALTSRGPIKLIRLQLRSYSDPVKFDKRERVLAGGGSYYSFARREYEWGDGADILFWSDEKSDEKFETGLRDEAYDYGFVMYTGQGAPDDLMTLNRDAPPSRLEPSIDAWKYLWDYKPPTEIESVRAEQRKSNDELYVAGVPLSKRVAVKTGGIYLLRSIRIKRSDLLIGFCVVDTLRDRSVVIAWTTLNAFDTPIATDHKD